MTSRRNSRRAVTGIAAVAATAALAMTGCSGGGDQSGSAPAAGSSEGTVTIDYLHRLPDGDGMTKVADTVKRWNEEHPEIQVNATKFDGQAVEMNKKLETDVKANSAPCLAQLDYAETPTMYVKGLTEDVTEYAEKYKDNFSGAMANMTIGGVTVGLPQDTGPLVFYYNKAIFDELGLTVPTTMDEFKATAAKAKEKGKYISSIGASEIRLWVSGQAAAAGAEWYVPEGDAWKVNVESDESKRVSDFWQEQIDAKTVLTLDSWNTDAFPKALGDQELIGHIGAGWEAPILMGHMADTPNEGQWAVALLPDYGDGIKTGGYGGSGVTVMKGCEHPAEAMEFLNWFNSQIDDLVSQGLIVAAKGEMKTPDTVKEFYGGQDVFAELAKANESLSPDFTYMPYFPTLNDAMNKAAAGANDGTGKFWDIFTTTQTESVKALRDNGLPVAE